MTTTLSPLSPENALGLLKRAMAEEPGALAQTRVAARLEQSILLSPVPPEAPTATAGPGTALAPLAASPKVLLGLTLLAGVGIGIGVDRWAIPETSRASAAVAAESSRPALAEPPVSLDFTPTSDAVPTVQAEDLPRIPAVAQKRHASELAPGQVAELASESPQADLREPQALSPTASLREQQALLDQARLALGKGQTERCLVALATHHGRFPQSLLAEERDALTIKALAAAGNLSEAHERAAAFLTTYPKSLLIPSLEATVGRIR